MNWKLEYVSICNILQKKELQHVIHHFTHQYPLIHWGIKLIYQPIISSHFSLFIEFVLFILIRELLILNVSVSRVFIHFIHLLFCSVVFLPTPQLSNSHILVVIHITTASQTIKVSIDDTPPQVDRCSDALGSCVYRSLFLYLFSLLHLSSGVVKLFSSSWQIKDLCWASLKTCVKQTMCYVCVAGMWDAKTSGIPPELLRCS